MFLLFLKLRARVEPAIKLPALCFCPLGLNPVPFDALLFKKTSTIKKAASLRLHFTIPA